MKHYRGVELPAEVQKLRRWLDNIRQHPAIRATQRHPEGDQKYEQELMRHYSKYAGECSSVTRVPTLLKVTSEGHFRLPDAYPSVCC